MVARDDVAALLAEHDGLLALQPALVARSWIAPGRRLGLSDSEYDAGERGSICERWLASTTPAGNLVTVDGEGVSTVATRAGSIRLDELVAAAPDLVMGADYARTHDGLGRLAKVFDYGERVPFHIHPPTEQAKLSGNNSKDEAYYFLPVEDLGAHPESFFGVHPSMSVDDVSDRLVTHLQTWRGTEVLGLSRAYHQFPEEGFFVPSGLLHAPGTALTFELQEDSDSMAFLQAQCGHTELSKDLLFKDIEPRRAEEVGEAAILDWIDWEMNQEPDVHARFHLTPRVLTSSDGVEVAWIVWGSTKFTGKRVRIAPGKGTVLTEPGTYGLFVWSGSGQIAGRDVVGGRPGSDEMLVSHRRAVAGVEVRNLGTETMEVLVFFGPDVVPDAPTLPAG